MFGGDDIVMKMGLDTSGFDDAAARSTASLNGMVLAAGAAAAAIGALGAAAVKYAAASREQALAEAQLVNTLRLTGSSLTLDVVTGYAAARQAVTNYGDEATLQAVRLLAPMKLNEDQTLKLVTVAQDLATQTGTELPAAVSRLTRAISTGRVTGLEPYLGALTESEEQLVKTGDAADIAGVLIAKANESIAGSAEAAVDPQVQFNNALGDFDQAVGKLVQDDVDGVLRDLTGAVLGLTTAIGDEDSRQIRAFGEALGSIPIAQVAKDLRELVAVAGALGSGDRLGASAAFSRSVVGFLLNTTGARLFMDDEDVSGLNDFLGISPQAIGRSTVTEVYGDGSGADLPATSPTGSSPAARRDPWEFTLAQAYGLTLLPDGSFVDPGTGRAVFDASGSIDAQAGSFGVGPVDVEVPSMRGIGAQAGFAVNMPSLAGGNPTEELRALQAEQRASEEMWATWGSAGVSAVHQVGSALFELASGTSRSFEEVTAGLLKSIGSQLVNLGIQQLFQAGFEALSANPVAAPRATLAGLAIAGGLGMGGIGGAIVPPVPQGAGFESRPLRGGAPTASGGGGGQLIVNNYYGAVGPNPEDAAREIQRIVGIGREAGIDVTGGR